MNLNKILLSLITALALYVSFMLSASAYELSGSVTAEGRVFFNDPLFNEQRRDSISLAAEPEFYYEWESGSSFTFTPFVRLDSADPERTNFDIRELHYLWVNDGWELRIGISKVFWGVTEFLHLVDIINQTDLVEYIDGEEKLGQPMINLSAPRSWGVMDFFILPYFRERTFPGKKGRFRTGPSVETDKAVYDSSAKEYNIDLAVRYSHTIGEWDFGIYHFSGTGREPTLLTGLDTGGDPVLIPFYRQTTQTGLDVQAVEGNWLLKLESIFRTGQGGDFFASVTGFEYSFVNIASSGIDLGLIGEWAYDERGRDTVTAFDNDIMLGARLALNDAESTEALIGLVQDLDSRGSVFSLESSRRISDHLKVTLDAFFVPDSSERDAIHSFRNDDGIQIELAYYF